MKIDKRIILDFTSNEKNIKTIIDFINNLQGIKDLEIKEKIVSINNKNVKDDFFHILGKINEDFYITSTKLYNQEKEYLNNNKEFFNFLLDKIKLLVSELKEQIEEGYCDTAFYEFITLEMLKPFYKEYKEFKIVKNICFKVFENFNYHNFDFLNDNFYQDMYIHDNLYTWHSEPPENYHIDIDLCENK